MNGLRKTMEKTGIYFFFISLFLFTQLNWAKSHNHYQDIELRVFFALVLGIAVSFILVKLARWIFDFWIKDSILIESRLDSLSLSLFPGIFFVLGSSSGLFLIVGMIICAFSLFYTFNDSFRRFLRFVFYQGRYQDISDKRSYSLVFAFLISFLLILFVYPEILTMKKTPMGSTTWELQDPVVSHMNFIPGHNVISYEMFKNGNILWSNLRGLGMPLLGNDIQAAPMFPLTMLLSWIPGKYFWSIYVLVRLFLLSAAAYLVAFEVLKFRKMSSVFFMFTFIYALYVLRWMNHPYQNGLLAGLWYIYFLGKLPYLSFEKYNFKRLLCILGLTLSVYSLVTCGFPEASAMSAILVLLIYPVLIIGHVFRKEIRYKSFLFDIIIGHALGFALSSPQVYSLIEFISLTNPDYRATLGMHQFSFADIYPYFLGMITSFSNSHPSYPNPQMSIHMFGLIPLYLFFAGVFLTFMHIKKVRICDLAAVMCGVFFMLKLFPFWPWFNESLGSLPILRESWFTVYFFPIFLWFFAYFVARGADHLLETFRFDKLGYRIEYSAITVILAVFIIIGLFYLSPYIGGKGYIELLKTHKDYVSLKVLILFSVFILLMLFYINFRIKEGLGILICLMFFFLMVGEMITIRPIKFMSFDYFNETFNSDVIASRIAGILKENAISNYEVRIKDSDGRYVSRGIATADDGAPAILQERLRRFRTGLFQADWNGYLPLKKPKFPYSWRLASNNLYVSHGVNPSMMRGLKILGSVNNTHYLYYDEKALPRAYIPARCFFSKGLSESVKHISNKNEFLLGDVYVEDLTESEKIVCKKFNSLMKRVKIIKDAGSEIVLEGIIGPTILVLNDNFYPGWKAFDRITGENLVIKPANITFRALILTEKKEYAVTFKYRPEWINKSLILIMTSLLGILILFCFALRAKNKQKT